MQIKDYKTRPCRNCEGTGVYPPNQTCEVCCGGKEEIIYPIELGVKYALANEFVSRVAQTDGCKIVNVVELKSGPDGVLIYHVDCDAGKEDLITDYAFMTWIKNPVFQKYYHGTKAFDKISEDYLKSREQTCAFCGSVSPTNGYNECENCMNKRLSA